MRSGRLVTPVVVCLAWLAPAMAARTDYAAILVGRWVGAIQSREGRAQMSAERTLVIESVTEAQGGWAVRGRFGQNASHLRRFDGTLEAIDGGALLRFSLGGHPVELRLQDGKTLTGTIWRPGGGRGGSAPELPLKLEKAE